MNRALKSCESDIFVQFLIEIAPQLTKENNNKGETPLLHACNLVHTNTETLKLLIKTDPSSVNVPDNNGCTPLHKGTFIINIMYKMI
jgi:ankyrin repeat protein